MSGPESFGIRERHGQIRPATAADYAEFLRLFPELAVDDPPMAPATFAREVMPTMIVMVADRSAEALGTVNMPGGAPRALPSPLHGYAFFQIMKDLAYVRHIVTAPEARRRGVGQSLMRAVADRARQAGCARWCLNVKPTNRPAIALYEQMGLSCKHESQALKIPWERVEAADLPRGACAARPIDPGDDGRVEEAMSLVSGQLASARALGGRVLMALHDEADAIVGATVFDPNFPGAYPFRVARPELALELLLALRAHARPHDSQLKVVCEGQRAVTDALVAAGASIDLEILHMVGALPGNAP